MTALLEKAFAEAAKLSPAEQDALAEQLLADLASERRWAEAFAGSQAELARLADEATVEFQRGQTKTWSEDL
jgi:hypothetical protein